MYHPIFHLLNQLNNFNIFKFCRFAIILNIKIGSHQIFTKFIEKFSTLLAFFSNLKFQTFSPKYIYQKAKVHRGSQTWLCHRASLCNPRALRRTRKQAGRCFGDLCHFHRLPKNAERRGRQSSVQRRSLSRAAARILASEKSLMRTGTRRPHKSRRMLRISEIWQSGAENAKGLSAARNVSGLNGILGRARSNDICIHSRPGQKGPRDEQRLLYLYQGRVRHRERKLYHFPLVSMLLCGWALAKQMRHRSAQLK